ncbi:MAG: hypothetical protein R2779_03780 [Crocinitomicaceae bacterium]
MNAISIENSIFVAEKQMTDMNWEDIIFYVALITLPAGAVLMTTILFLRKQTERELNSQFHNVQSELKKQRQEYFLPNRVEAYQRAVLLMERIHPNSLIMRTINPALPSAVYQTELLKTIREEYDHNVAQQLFVSPAMWEMVKNSKEETIKIINIAGQQMSVTSMSTDLAAKIFELVAEIGELPSEITVKALKEDLQKLF